MADSIYKWSLTAASNDAIDGIINWRENQLPDTVNDSARAMMKRVAEWREDLTGSLLTTGTQPAYTVTSNAAFDTLANGRAITVNIHATNTATPATLNVNGLGSRQIRKFGATGDAPLAISDLQAGGVYTFYYSTTANGGAGGWIVGSTMTSGGNLDLSGNSILNVNNLTMSGALTTTGTGTITSAGNITTTGKFIATGSFMGNTANVTLAPTGSGTIHLRPNGDASTTGETTIGPSGAMTIGGPVTAGAVTGTAITGTTITGTAITGTGVTSSGNITANQNFQSSTAAVVMGTTGAGTVYLRPQGVASGAGQATIDQNGNLVTTGNMTTYGTVLYIDQAGASNCHVWMRRSDHSTEAALMYWNATDNTLRFRIGGTEYLKLDTAAVTVATGQLQSANANLVFGATGGGGIYLRPSGVGSVTGQAQLAGGRWAVSGGYTCHTQETTGGFGSNSFNFYWSGSTVQVFIDNTYLGNIAFTCDYRIKDNVQPLGSVWEGIKKLRPISYTHKAYEIFEQSNEERWGLTAHEAQEALFPGVASGGGGETDLLSLNPIPLITALAKGLQEAMARIEALEAKVA